MMNITFRGATQELEDDDARARRGSAAWRACEATARVGGLRASIYNAFPEEGVHRLVELLDDVERGRP